MGTQKVIKECKRLLARIVSMRNIFALSLSLLTTAGLVVVPALAHNHGSDKEGSIAMEEKEGSMAMEASDIVSVAVEAGDFETLATALEAANLVETLQGDGPFTVFAPTDEAFAALPEGTLEQLLDPENIDQLTAILTYHVVPGMVTSADIEPGDVETVQGSTVELTVEDGTVMVNDATVVAADVKASNGVIHVIDTVILPSEE